MTTLSTLMAATMDETIMSADEQVANGARRKKTKQVSVPCFRCVGWAQGEVVQWPDVVLFDGGRYPVGARMGDRPFYWVLGLLPGPSLSWDR
jgi:hypothetical protein